MVTRRPVPHRYTFHTTATVTILQNARRAPGDSARLARVELSEKAITRPATASAPSAFAPGVSGRLGELAIVMELDGTRGAPGPTDGNVGDIGRSQAATTRAGDAVRGDPRDDQAVRVVRGGFRPPPRGARGDPHPRGVGGSRPPLNPPGRAAPAGLPAGRRS